MTTGQADPAPGAPNLVLPAQPARAFAIYASRGARTTGPGAPSALPSALAARGIRVLTLDLGAAPSRMLSRIRSEIDIEGPLDDGDRRRLLEIADRCPVHRTLASEIVLETTEADLPTA